MKNIVKKRRVFFVFTISILLFAVIALIPAGAATYSTIDFEGLTEGLVLETLSSGNGVAGDPVAGSIAVRGINPMVPLRNSAVIFDAACGPGGVPADCTGDDDDLFKPSLGNVLIVNIPARLNSDGLVTSPNDDDKVGMQLKFDFANWGSGVVNVESLDVMDVEAEENEFGGHVDLFVGGEFGTLANTVLIPPTGDNGTLTLDINTTGVDYMIVTLNGSGAIDNIRISEEVEEPPTPTPEPTNPGTGTIGYWKNHPEAWPVDVITIGGNDYSRDEAIAIMKQPVKGDKTLSMFPQLVAAKLNVLIGNENSCIADNIAAADAWMGQHPAGSGVKAKNAEWKNEGSALHQSLDDYNNGNLCAPHRG